MLTNREVLGNTSWRRGPLKTGIGESNTDRHYVPALILSTSHTKTQSYQQPVR